MTLISLTIFFYTFALILQILNLFEKFSVKRKWILSICFLGLLLHGILLHHGIDLAIGQNLTVFNLLSLIAWLCLLLIFLISIFKPIDFLLLLILPITIFSIFLVWFFPAHFIVALDNHWRNLFHILLSILTSAILCLGGLQAILLAFQEWMLRTKPSIRFVHKLPPLVTMEALTFKILQIGFILLSLLFVTSIYSFYALFSQSDFLVHKTVLVGIIWLALAILLSGRFIWGWRGKKAIYAILLAVLLLVIIYFGSEFYW